MAFQLNSLPNIITDLYNIIVHHKVGSGKPSRTRQINLIKYNLNILPNRFFKPHRTTQKKITNEQQTN